MFYSCLTYLVNNSILLTKCHDMVSAQYANDICRPSVFVDRHKMNNCFFVNRLRVLFSALPEKYATAREDLGAD